MTLFAKKWLRPQELHFSFLHYLGNGYCLVGCDSLKRIYPDYLDERNIYLMLEKDYMLESRVDRVPAYYLGTTTEIFFETDVLYIELAKQAIEDGSFRRFLTASKMK